MNTGHRPLVQERRQILLVNPANAVRDGRTHHELSIYPNLGLLTLGTALRRAASALPCPVEVLYFDGALLGNHLIHDFIEQHAQRVAFIGYSSYTNNYSECVRLATHAKSCNPQIVNVIGNDHFSALAAEVMRRRQGIFDYGFSGNDVVEGFTCFVSDLLVQKAQDLSSYAGLVYRDPHNPDRLGRNREEPSEFSRLPLVDYAFADSMLPHTEGYHQQQQANYRYMREAGLRATVIEIARGCLKFAGTRNDAGVPLNACDFCGIIPGSQALAATPVERAWDIIHNAVVQGYNYLFLTTDELPSTFWGLLKGMAENKPEWYLDTHPADRPRMMCYARADAFREHARSRIDLLMHDLNLDHFFVGLDGFTEISLRAMNKGINQRANDLGDLLHYNLLACQEIARRGGKLTAGAVLTHIGITREVMEANFQLMRRIMEEYPRLFAELDFELLCPVPGSLSFAYLSKPGAARARANALQLEVNDRYLEAIIPKYQGQDLFDPEELVQDFIVGCCPDITVELAYAYLSKIEALAEKHHITYECSSL